MLKMKGEKTREKVTAKSAEDVLAASSTALSQLQSVSKEFEKDVIGNFVLKLYHDLLIQSDGLIQKKRVRMEFNYYIKVNSYRDYFDNKNIGTLLRSNNFLFHTPKGSEMFCIPMRRLFEYRNEKLKYLDELRINNNSAIDSIVPDSSENPFEATVEVSPDAEEFPVIYQGGWKQEIKPDFILTSLGCVICQKNFQIQSHFEDHLSRHGFESDFEFLSTVQTKRNNIFEVSYRLCNASHYFSFTMKTKEKDIVIEKIIIVQTRLMHYVKNNKVPYEIATDGMDSFLVDSHLFTIGVEQPIVVIYRHKFDKATRFVEQHHFLRTDEFPTVHFPIRSYRVPRNPIMKSKLKLKDYFPSSELKIAQKEKFSDASLCNISNNFRQYLLEERVLNAGNMCHILKCLLEIEDLEGMRDYVTLRQKAVKINRFGREYSVKLQGLPQRVFLENVVTPLDEIILVLSDGNSENDLTNVDDTLFIRQGGKGKRKKLYFAVVERVYDNNICFKYDKSIINEKKLYDIILRPSRLALKYQYRAIDMLSANLQLKQYLFPSDGNISNNTSIPTVNFELFNPTIGHNPEQLQAVRNIADGEKSFAPYVIFGPPGTGKTSTVVEAVLQLWQRHPDSRILITAGSNSACDEVALRLCRILIDLQPDKPNILRIYAKSNEKRLDSIEDILIQASNFYCVHFYPAVQAIREYRIVVCTLSVVGKLVTADIGQDFFTHIFVDECAASTEPEVLVGFMGTSSSKTRLIISGDHKQLGPLVRSQRANELGLNVSFMERLMNQGCYAVNENGDYDRSIQTRLIQNFRSHPEIVNLYNHLYYNNELKAMAKKDDVTWGSQWHMLPNKDHPIIFHAVHGSSRQSRSCISLCNELEVNTVMDYVKDLMHFGIKGRKIEETDIGIISPYKKQYTRIQEELNERRWHQIEVGAVETFQGKEKPIIIVSTVRSNTKTLGFLDNPRRLNVILSRAKCLLIIIGNPKTLRQNKDFKYIIDECLRNKCTIGGFRGCSDEEKSGDETVENGLRKLSLSESVAKNVSSKKIYTKENEAVASKSSSYPIQRSDDFVNVKQVHYSNSRFEEKINHCTIDGFRKYSEENSTDEKAEEFDDFVEAIVLEAITKSNKFSELVTKPQQPAACSQHVWNQSDKPKQKLPKKTDENPIRKAEKRYNEYDFVDVGQSRYSVSRLEERKENKYSGAYTSSSSPLRLHEKRKSKNWCRVS